MILGFRGSPFYNQKEAGVSECEEFDGLHISVGQHIGTDLVGHGTQEDRFVCCHPQIFEDSSGTKTIGSLLAVVDGFWKEENGVRQSGASIAEFVARNLESHFRAFMAETEGKASRAIWETFRQLDGETSLNAAGAVVAMAWLDLTKSTVHTAALGDSLAVIYGADGRKHFNPVKHLDLGGEHLWGCLGDRMNRHVYDQNPEVHVRKFSPGTILLLCTDGFVGTLRGGKRNSFKIHKVINQTFRAVINNPRATASDLVQDAVERETNDNITVILAKMLL